MWKILRLYYRHQQALSRVRGDAEAVRGELMHDQGVMVCALQSKFVDLCTRVSYIIHDVVTPED